MGNPPRSAVPALAGGFGTASVIDAAGVVHRVLLDRVRKIYCGYDVAVESQAGDDTYAVTFQPLALPQERRQELLGTDYGSWTQLPAPMVPAAQTVRSGRIMKLDLTSSAWGQTLVDYLAIQEPVVSA